MIKRLILLLVICATHGIIHAQLSVYNNEQAIYNALSLYGAEDLALLPGEVIIKDNNLIFKITG